MATVAVVVALSTLALSASVSAASHDLSIVDFAFEPVEQTVFTGEAVGWTNNGAETHTVTSIEGSELDSGNVAPTEGYGHVFEKPGTYAYHCTIHPDTMKGTITVQAAAATPTPSGSAEPTPPSGTLPPNFSPNPPPAVETPTPEPTAAPSATPAATPIPTGTTGDNGGRTALLIIVVLAVVFGTLLALWLRRRRAA